MDFASALKYLHSELPNNVSIIHRDLKPANCFVFADLSVVKVGDFGLSRFKDGTSTMTAVGTPLYIAPEIWAREQYDESIDMCAS